MHFDSDFDFRFLMQVPETEQGKRDQGGYKARRDGERTRDTYEGKRFENVLAVERITRE